MARSFSNLKKFPAPWIALALCLELAAIRAQAQVPTPGAFAGKTNRAGIKTLILLPHTPFTTRYYLIDSAVPGPTVMIVGGVHGNEPAGAFAAEGIRHWTVQKGRLLVLPCANVPGLAADKRLIPGLDTNLNNLNRNYPKADETDGAGARGELAQAIWQLALDYKPDWVLDLHEGYDFHQLNDKSVGSSVICFPLPAAQPVADAMIETVNVSITNNNLKFVRRDLPVDGSLARAAGAHLHVPGMTLETTKTQPMEKRVGQQEVMVHCLLEKIGMMPPGFVLDDSMHLDNTNILALIARPKIVTAMYKGPGTGGDGPPNLLKLLNSKGDTSLTEVTPQEIRDGILTNFDVVIFGGGSGSKEAEALEESGREQVLQFVSKGGGYIGICAGAYLATDGYPWSLHIINAKTLSSKWNRGKGRLQMELTANGAALLGSSKTNVEVLYHNGPVVGPANDSALPPYEPLAFFRTELANNDTPKGIMVDSPAIFASQFKQGRVVCISPHPEQTEGLDFIVPHALMWVAQAGKSPLASQ